MLGRWHLAPAVVDFLFLGQGVVDTGKQLQLLAEPFRQGPRRSLTPRAVLVGQQVQRGFKVQLFVLASDLNIIPAMVSSNSLFQALAPTTLSSCRNFSSSSDNWCGRIARIRSKTGL
jgi:hypothetical protein